MQTRKPRYVYFGFMSITTMFLIVACGFLFLQNQSMAKRNRELIIMNDSIMSANIELKTKTKILSDKIPRSSALTGNKKTTDREVN
jgi:uncharacterized protein YcfL